MGKLYRDSVDSIGTRTSTPEMREFCKRPGRTDEEGNLVYFTEQHHKDACNINNIVKKYNKTGLLEHTTSMEHAYGDCTGQEFKDALDLAINAQREFYKFPSEIRKRFNNSVQEYFQFMENPSNRDEAIKLGLVDVNWTDETDGLGEYIKKGTKRDPKPPEEPVEPKE